MLVLVGTDLCDLCLIQPHMVRQQPVRHVMCPRRTVYHRGSEAARVAQVGSRLRQRHRHVEPLRQTEEHVLDAAAGALVDLEEEDGRWWLADVVKPVYV